MTKIDMFRNWVRLKRIVSKAEVMQYGCDNYFISAYRVMQKLVEKEEALRLTEEECVFRNLKGKMAWYKWKEAEDENRQMSFL